LPKTTVKPRHTDDQNISSSRNSDLFETGLKAGIQPQHATKLARQLKQLDRSKQAAGMNVPGGKLHAPVHDMDGHWSVWVNGNWRLSFTFNGEDAVLVDYQDYH
jgi:toxin HigB-1